MSLSTFWKGKDAKAWSDQVGEHGDELQQRYLKTFIVSCIVARQKKSLHIASIFPRALHRAAQSNLAELSNVEKWRAIVGDAKTLLDLSRHLVIDLGCGEGYMLRFLRQFNATCIGLDCSEILIREAKKKLAPIAGALTYEVSDFQAKDFALFNVVSDFIKPRGLDEFKHLIIITMNVLDHIKDPRNLLKQIAALSRQHGDATIVISTLNPSFFIKLGPPRHITPDEFVDQDSLELQLDWATSPARIFPRDWAAYDDFFSATDFNVDYFYATDLDDLTYEVSIPLGSQWPRAGGPFLLWHLTSLDYPPVSPDTVDELFSQCNFFSSIDPSVRSFLRHNAQSLALRKFTPGAQVAMPGAICSGISIVTAGSFIVVIDKSTIQEFMPSSAFGDLESCQGFYAGRYLYEVRAGNGGGTCLVIPNDVFNKILEGRLHNSAGDRLFVTMRNRFNAYNPFYHRSIEIRPSQHPSEQVRKSKYIAKNKKMSVRDIEHVIRCFVTLVAVQEDKFRSAPDDTKFRAVTELLGDQTVPDSKFRNVTELDNPPGLTIFINPTNLKIWLSGRDPVAKERPFAYELAILHKVGIIDAFTIPKIGEDMEALRNSVKGFYDYLVRAAVRLIVGRRYTEFKGEDLSDDELAYIIKPQHLDELTTSLVVRNLNAEAIRLTAKCQEAMNESQHALNLMLRNADQARAIAADYYFNISFLKWALFARDERRLVVIRDYPFLRRVTGGGVQWIDELASRLELRDRMVTAARDKSHPARVDNYFRHVTAYVLEHWHRGWDLDYSGPHGHKKEGAWRALVQTG